VWPGSRLGSGYPAFLFRHTVLNKGFLATDPTNPLEKELLIVNELGLHARAAAKIAKLAAKAEGFVWLRVGDQISDAKSILDILSLGCHRGTAISIQIEKECDRHILAAISRLVEIGFDEPE